LAQPWLALPLVAVAVPVLEVLDQTKLDDKGRIRTFAEYYCKGLHPSRVILGLCSAGMNGADSEHGWSDGIKP
jgi:hypothetical protein